MRPIFIITLLSLFTSVCFSQAAKDSFYYRKIAEPGVKFIPVYQGKYKVFTQKVGNGKIKLLLLHGGPANSHEYMENFPAHLNPREVTIYYYDQLGSYYSDQPEDSTIWDINRFVDEVEEVRKGLGLEQFYILGHSWGATLAKLYAAKYPTQLKGLVLSNAPARIRDTAKNRARGFAFGTWLEDNIKSRSGLKELPAATFDSIVKKRPLADSMQNSTLSQLFNKTKDSILMTFNYRLPGKLPEPILRNSLHANHKDRVKNNFDRQIITTNYIAAIEKIKGPVLLIGGKYDRMGQEFYPEMKEVFINARVRLYLCPNSGHFSMWDDTENYFREVTRFLKEVENNSFDPEK